MRWFLGLILFSLVTAAVGIPADAAEVIGEGSKVISIEKDQGILIRLARPANTVFVANPEIADIQVKSPRLVYVFGKNPGTLPFSRSMTRNGYWPIPGLR